MSVVPLDQKQPSAFFISRFSTNTGGTCLLTGGAALDLNAVEPKPRQWIQDMTWLNLVELSRLPKFTNILKDVPRKEKVSFGMKTLMPS